mmetsp:Transcript_34682/g.35376  ORF Transcript_34682/g.35376 Transcript_34682/m.35376 type:complete len:459 (+) Transcript_34682:66-1442(+)
METAIRQRETTAIADQLLSFIDDTKTRLEALTILKDLLLKTTDTVKNMINSERTLESSSGNDESENSLLILENVQFIEPRGRFKVRIGPHGFHNTGKSISIFIPWGNISCIISVPSSSSSKKEGEDILTIHTVDPVLTGGKPISNVVWLLSRSKQISTANISGCECNVIRAIIESTWKKNIVVPSNMIFQSSASQPYFRCYKGVQEGVLYFLPKGILFLKPVLFLPVEAIESVVAGRGGSAVTRYIDLIVVSKGKEIEFTNIDREELPFIQQYVSGHLEKMRRKAEKNEATKTKMLGCERQRIGKTEGNNTEEDEGEEENDSDEDTENDEDFDPDGSDSDEDQGSEEEDEDEDDNDSDNSDEDVDEERVNNDANDKHLKLKSNNTVHGEDVSKFNKENNIREKSEKKLSKGFVADIDNCGESSIKNVSVAGCKRAVDLTNSPISKCVKKTSGVICVDL